MNKKIFSYFVAFLVTAFLVACSGSKDTTATKKDTTKVKPTLQQVTLPYLQSLNDKSEVLDVRFHFEREFVLRLVPVEDLKKDEISGIRTVNENGAFIDLSNREVRFPVSKLGKFISSDPQSILQRKDKISITWEEGDESQKSFLFAQYDDSLRLVVVEDGLVNAKPYVAYEGLKYYLPEDYKENFIIADKIDMGNKKVVSGVKTPGQEADGN